MSEVPSTVVSEVPSTVVSEVPSTVTSDVPSAVGSAVTSSVASGVPISKKDARSVRIYKLPKLTPKVLLDFAQKDYIKNPAKYRLSEKEIIKLLKMYEPEIMEKQMEFYDESLNETLERDSLIDKELIERDSLKLDTNKMDTLELSTF